MIPPRLSTLSDLLRLLAETTNYEERLPTAAIPRAFDLSRTEGLLASVGDPQNGPLTVHVTGSKGKGSTCRMVAEVLRATGRGPVGLYVSPHLVRLSERVTVDGVEVPGDDLAHDANALLPHLRATFGTDRFPTFFEILTATAHMAFRRLAVRSVVLEVGLGGRLDATNVCRPAATAVTSVEREHTSILGDAIEAIAFEKAGIWKAGVPAVSGVPGSSPAAAVVERRAREVGAPLHRLGAEILLEGAVSRPGPETRARVGGPAGAPPLDVSLPVAGVHQARNAAVAVALARLVGVPDSAIVAGLARVTLPARMERVRTRPDVVIDSAHTAASARAAAAAVRDCFPCDRLHLVVGALGDKDVSGMLAALVPLASRVIACGAPSPRALSPSQVAARVREVSSVPVVEAADARAALSLALASAAEGDLVLVTGSTYLAGAALASLRP